MIRKFRIQDSEFRIIFVFFAFLFLFFTFYLLPKAKAQVPCGSDITNPRAQGLVTAQTISGKFGTNSGCADGKKTAFLSLETYDDLKVKYFDNSKASKTTITNGVWPTGSFSGDGVYWIKGPTNPNLSLPNPNAVSGNGTQVVFVDGDFAINHNITYHTSDSDGGLVFIVKGNIYIKKTVDIIDAVLISFGSIYTASTNQAPCTTNSEQVNALTVNGSLITLNPDSANKIYFCRKLANNALAAEKINAQVKYLILLRHMLSEVIQRWAEI